MGLAYENLRLGELAIIADLNRPFYLHFEKFLSDEGYHSSFEFIRDEDTSRAERALLKFIESDLREIKLFDGIARPYPDDKAKWLFLGWFFRDAPAQRLQPMVTSVAGASLNQKKSKLLNMVRQALVNSFPTADHWTWYTFREVMIDRLEGSRRSIKGSLFEVIVRRALERVFKEDGLNISVSKSQISLEGETYDVVVEGAGGRILMPVKTRETMGGGHALLFTRDIHKAIATAHKAGLQCVPVVIAESWGGNLSDLDCENFIYIDRNPNQISAVEELLYFKTKGLSDFYRQVCL
jgi:hypothetical protein